MDKSVIGQKMLIVVANQNPKSQKSLNHRQRKEKKNHIWNVSGLARLINQSGNSSVVLQNVLKSEANLQVPMVKVKAVKNQKKSVKMEFIQLKMTVLVSTNVLTVTDGRINIVHPISFSMVKFVTGPKTSTVTTTVTMTHQTMTHQTMTHQAAQRMKMAVKMAS